MSTELVPPVTVDHALPPWAPGRADCASDSDRTGARAPGTTSGPPTGAVLRRFVRYGSVSVVSTATGLTVLGLLVYGGFPAQWSNVIATGVGTIPSFELNRRWVWRATSPGPTTAVSRRRVLAQALPYCLLSLAGLVVSTVAVHVASDLTSDASRLVHTGAVETANLGAYGSLWLLQFVLCDRFLFGSRRTGSSSGAGGRSSTRIVAAQSTSSSMRGAG